MGTGNINLEEYKKQAERDQAYVVLEVKSSEDLKKSVKLFKNLWKNKKSYSQIAFFICSKWGYIAINDELWYDKA